ncbi:DUF6274 family protein [Streptomyces sp. NPDC059816]|uniref:DUF6274 family protein n=1 Tax=Streptomyces sp. NPDC059816 TaxID=3346960 RepID=UPI0036608F76
MRPHPSAASRHRHRVRHRVRHCPVCAALQKLAMEPPTHLTESREDPEREIPPNE